MHDWSDAAFLAAAAQWVEGHVRVTGELEQVHLQPWSTVLRVPSAEGTVWFKAARAGVEASVTELLHRAVPERAPELLASDADRGWMLLADAGVRLRELIETPEDLWRWERFLPEYGQLQLAVSRLTQELLDAGVPDLRLSGLAPAVAQLLEEPEFLMVGHAEGLTADERRRLSASIPRIASMARELEERGVPETIQHDDLNDGNVYVRDGLARAYDWGDACVSHPFHSLTVTLRATAYRLDLEPGGVELTRLRDAYLEAFSEFATRSELQRAAELAYRTGTLARALAWRGYLATTPPAERGDDLEAVPYGLRKFLEGGPIGTWR